MSEQENKSPNNVTPDGKVVSGRARPGRPAGAEKKVEARPVEKKEVLFYTPNGRLCKKTFEITRTKSGSYKRLISVEKNVKE